MPRSKEFDPIVELGKLLKKAKLTAYFAYPATLTCVTCGAKQHCPVEQSIAYQLLKRWPLHCDEAMTIEITPVYVGRFSGSWQWTPAVPPPKARP